jgi:tRNA A-37 threonylcarbamoyl transferase component Bud32
MSFEPLPGFRIQLHNESYEFTAYENSVFVYAEAGKEAVVYRLKKNQKQYALKVFYPAYQDSRLITNSEKLNQFQKMEGLAAAGRTVLTRKAFPDLIAQYPELEYAVLMNWVHGNIWGNLLTDNHTLSAEKYKSIAIKFLSVMSNLEKNGLAHCDLSNNNLLVDVDKKSIELIDIENMYAINMPRPVPDISYGTKGYRNAWIAENGLWGLEADRFGTAILAAEILSWHSLDIRQAKSGLDSFFAEEEFGKNCERYQIIRRSLQNTHADLAILFEKVWKSTSPDTCPTIREWKTALDQTIPSITSSSGIGSKPVQPSSKPFTFVSGKIVESFEPSKGAVPSKVSEKTPSAPARMQISHSVLDYGVVNSPNPSITFEIQNTGGVEFRVTITVIESWIQVTPTEFNLQPREKLNIKAVLKENIPMPSGKTEFRSISALIIESDAGPQVIGVVYKIPKKGFWG